MSDISEDPPDENEQYENLDESLDELDLPGNEGGPEGERELGYDVIADETALHEVGADLDDPDRISLLEGSMDDPDGTGPYDEDADDGGSDEDRFDEVGRSGDG